MNKAIKTCSFIMPGEFEKQKSVWIVWPHNKKDWPGYFNSIPGTIANIISNPYSICINFIKFHIRFFKSF